MAHIDAGSFDTPMVINAYTTVWPAKEAFLCNNGNSHKWLPTVDTRQFMVPAKCEQIAHDIITLDKPCSSLHVRSLL